MPDSPHSDSAKDTSAKSAATTTAIKEQRSDPDGWPKPLSDVAYYGLGGEIVRTLLPRTEADPAALLFHFYVTFGNAVGRGPFLLVEDGRHGCNLFAMFIGATGVGRKGTAGQRIHQLFALADPEWAKQCVRSGMTTGEGVIHAVRDPIEKLDKQGNLYVHDEGIADKRLLLREEELSRMFRAMGRPRNSLVDVVRNAWDGRDLYVMTRKDPLRSTEPHISVSGDITGDELRSVFNRIDLVNGFGNRFLFCCTKRSKLLPYGGRLPPGDLAKLVTKLRDALDVARKIGRVRLDLMAQVLWGRELYVQLARERLGLAGAATERAAPQVLRLSMICALGEGSRKVTPEHLKAALEMWRYNEESVRYVLGDPHDAKAEKLLGALLDAGEDGLDGTQIHNLFGRHAHIKDLNQALHQLQSAGLITKVTEKTGGRPR